MERIDELIDCGAYSNRSEIIRDAIRKHITTFDNKLFREQKNQ
jgi:Arc/MetJ-type ribon-helix-helix transcriptional regulator